MSPAHQGPYSSMTVISLIAAMATKRLPHRAVGILVGCLIIILSLRTILQATGIGFLF